MSNETFVQIQGVMTLLSPLIFYLLGNYRGYMWARKNPDKSYMENFFEIEIKQ